jgi:hypothetical protein
MALRNGLLTLHKALIDSERTGFEKAMGNIQSPTHFLQLLTHDPWFAWLHPLSRLIVSADEALDETELLTLVAVDALMRRASRLLIPTEHGDGFSGHYFACLQRDPDVVLAHAEVIRLLAPRTSTQDAAAS